MPEGLSDQDRARIESARQSAGGCLNVAAFIAFAFAALVVLFVFFAAMYFSGNDGRFIMFLVGLGVFGVLVGLAFRWIAKQ
jgi:hypothetical protein